MLSLLASWTGSGNGAAVGSRESESDEGEAVGDGGRWGGVVWRGGGPELLGNCRGEDF